MEIQLRSAHFMSFSNAWYFFYSSFKRWLDWLRLRKTYPQATCQISWQPSVLAPVYHGFRDHALPSPCRVFYPSLEDGILNARILEGCGRFSLILFVHGNCNEAQHYKLWYELPARLARCGHIVVVPELINTVQGAYPWNNAPDVQTLRNILSWMQNISPYRNLLLPGKTGIIGHSYGAMLAAVFASQVPVSAYVSLSGGWLEWPLQLSQPVRSLRIPTLHMHGDGDGDIFAVLTQDLWNSLANPKHKVIFSGGEHWDYLPPSRSNCDTTRGVCNLVEITATDLACTFFGKYLAPEYWQQLGTIIPDNLIAPTLNLSVEQQPYARGHLSGLSLAADQFNCNVILAWENLNGQTGLVACPDSWWSPCPRGRWRFWRR